MLIGLYTGQRVADLLSLKPDQLREGPNDILYIDFVQKKNGLGNNCWNFRSFN